MNTSDIARPGGHESGPESGRLVYSVSRLNTEVKMVLEGSFPLLWVEGEISNLSRPSSGHLYFTLKDPHAQVACALFKNRGRLLGFTPANGQQVLVRARVTLYDVRGNYQLGIEHMEPAGDGLLRRRFEELKARLDREGLFAEARKRPLPALPARIGVITSASGAAIRDVLSVLKRRFPAVPVRVYPVPVQGADAAPRIASAIALANRRRDCDLLILTRGGGSLEDLWAFNEEIVARALAAGTIPTISAVGHEIDMTIADFVADRRAPTPSAAAEMAVPDRREIGARLAQLDVRLRRRVATQLDHTRMRLAQTRHRLNRLHPRQRLLTLAQRLDELELRLRRGLAHRLAERDTLLRHLARRLDQRHPRRRVAETRTTLEVLRRRLFAQSPAQRIARDRTHLAGLARRLPGSLRRRLRALRERVQHDARALHAISPLATLDRGYAIARRDDGAVLRAATEVRVGDAIAVRLAAGHLDCTVTAAIADGDTDAT